MKIEYMRSSSYNCWDFCQFQYFLQYVLNIKSLPNVKAEQGSCVHKALELLGRCKLAQQQNKLRFTEDETGTDELVKDFTPNKAIDIAWKYYSSRNVEWFKWDDSHKDRIYSVFNEAITYNRGTFNPMNQNVIEPEIFFDFVFPPVPVLRIKGTLDLAIRHGEIIELIDYKTGARKNWSTGKQKDYECLYNDPQLCIYFYALVNKFPKAESYIITIFYIDDGGVFSLDFSRADIPRIEKMISDRYYEILRCNSPRLIFPDFKCFKLCYYGRYNEDGDSVTYPNSICKKISEEVIELGLDKVVKDRYTDKGYSGGGRAEVK